jgi:hypothetical protein
MGKRPNTATDTVTLPQDVYDQLITRLQEKGLTLSDFVRMNARSFIRMPPVFNLDTKVTFGKFSGETMENVIRLAPSYVVWCMENIAGFAIGPDALKMLSDFVDGPIYIRQDEGVGYGD